MKPTKRIPTLDERLAALAGDDLTVPRERAMAILGAFYCRVTGSRFKLEVHGFEVDIDMPPYDKLSGHITDPSTNARYFRHAVAELLKFPNEIGELVAQDLEAFRLPPAPFSTELVEAFRLVKNVRARGFYFELSAHGERAWQAIFGCRSLTDAIEVLGSDVNVEPPMAIAVAAYNFSLALERKS